MLILATYLLMLSDEFFLILHILTAFIFASCWDHVIFKWGDNYCDNWLSSTCALRSYNCLDRMLRMIEDGF